MRSVAFYNTYHPFPGTCTSLTLLPSITLSFVVYQVPLPDLSELLPSRFQDIGYTDDDETQSTPLLISSTPDNVDILSMYAAQQGLPRQIPIKRHPFELAFALTDFKLQGRTLPKLILSICKRHRMPWMTLQSFYVLVSRCTSKAGLRLLQYDRVGIDNVRHLMPDIYLYAWERGYNDNGVWCDDLAVTALRNIRDLRQNDKRASAKRNREQPSRAIPSSPNKTRVSPGHKTPSPNKRQMLYKCSLCNSTEHRAIQCHLWTPVSARGLFPT
jgi:hypothetical protein